MEAERLKALNEAQAEQVRRAAAEALRAERDEEEEAQEARDQERTRRPLTFDELEGMVRDKDDVKLAELFTTTGTVLTLPKLGQRGLEYSGEVFLDYVLLEGERV